MLETILIGLLLSCVSALAFLAYQHHKAFMRIYWVLTAMIWIGYPAVLMWSIAVVVTRSKVTDALQLDLAAIAKAQAVTEPLEVATGWTFILSFFFWALYLQILAFLPEILGGSGHMATSERRQSSGAEVDTMDSKKKR